MTLIARPAADARLSPFVRCLWYCERRLAHAADRVLPTGAVQVIVDLADTRAAAGTLAVGPQTAASIVETTAMRRAAGIAFRVGGAWPVLAAPCAAFRDRTVDLALLWGRDAARLREFIEAARTAAAVLDRLEAVVVRRLADHTPNPLVRRAVRSLGVGRSVTAVVADSGLARASFARLFDREVGLSPKRWAGIARFQRAARRLADGDATLADVAAGCGYADQAHLTRAFRRYAGITPGAFRPRCADEPNHVAVE